MKLFHSSNPWRHTGISRPFRVLFLSSGTLTSSASSDTLYRRISRAGDPRVSIVPLLDQWSEEGRSVKQQELQRIVRQLRSYRRFKHALQLSEWMSDKMKLDLSPGDVVVRLDLISKVHGVEQAEKYFNCIPNSLRVFHTYGALLNCYARNKSLEKAEGLMQKMRELGFLKTSLSYKVMLNFISSLEKLNDIDGAEKIFKEWELGNTSFDFRVPNLMVSAYCKKGLLEKAEAFVSRLIESGKEPNASTWDRLALAYHMDKQTDKAVEMMKKAILVSRPGWKPHRGTLAACLEFLKRKGDVEVAGEFIRLLWEKGIMSADTCDRLESYIKDGNPGSIVFDKMGGVSIDTCDRLENDIKDRNLESIAPSQMGEDDEARDGEMHGVVDFKKENTN